MIGAEGGGKSDRRLAQRLSNFHRAFDRFEQGVKDALQDGKLSELEQEGLIQRFEVCLELAWKCLQDLLHERGYTDVVGPRPVVERAFRDGIITDGPLWMQMLQARNQMAHLYDEAIFRDVLNLVRGSFARALAEFSVRAKAW